MKIEELKEQKSVKRWMSNGLADSTLKTYIDHLGLFIKWLEKQDNEFSDYTPDMLVEYQRANSGSYEIQDLIKDYINSLNWRHSGKKSTYSTLRSLFKHNRVSLPEDVFKIRSNEPPVKGVLDARKIKAVIMSSSKAYQAVFSSMFQAALDLSMFEYWNLNGYEDLKEQLEGDPDIIKISLPGRKKARNIRPFYSFVGRDAIEKIRAYLKIRPTHDSEGQPTTAIFLTNQHEPVSKGSVGLYWLRHLHKLGIIDRNANEEGRSKRYGVNLHEMRDVFRTLWEKSPAAGSAAEFFMGHIVDPLGYQKAHQDEEWAREEYRKASGWINILSSDRPYGLVGESEVSRLERLLDGQQREIDTMREILRERSQSQKALEEDIIPQEIQFYRKVKELEALYPDTDEGFAQLTQALNKLREEGYKPKPQ